MPVEFTNQEKEVPRFVKDPVVIVTKEPDASFKIYVMHIPDEPIILGILLSDIADHFAAAYAGYTGRDQRDVRTQLVKIMRDEDRFKQKDPKRGVGVGSFILPRKQ
jgi:hypothetical protein